CFYLFSTYVLAYGRELGLRDNVILLAVNVAAAVELFTIPLFGALSDRWSRKGAYMLGCLLMIGYAFPYFALLQTRNPILALAVCPALLYSVQASLVRELFGTRLRYTGASLGYQLAAPFAGGLAPIIAASLVEAFPGRYGPLALYIIGISVLSLVCVACLGE